MLSRELFAKINPDRSGAHRIDQVLQELRDKLLYFSETFCSRFLNEEIRNSDFYQDGSALRHLATVKELFATHIALLWMTVKHTHGSLRGSRLGEDEQNKLEFIRTSVKSLLKNRPFLDQIAAITLEITSQEHGQTYSAVDLMSVLDTFEGDTTPAHDVNKLQRLQALYIVVHKYFMQKAGNYDLPYEIAQNDDAEFLFNKEVHGAQAAVNKSQIGNSFLKESVVNQVSTKRDGRKDFIMNAHGEDGADNADF